jgi:biopolymer transport protein ExbD
MHVHDQPADRRRADIQIRQAFVLTMLGLWIVVLLVFWCFTPINAPGVWPLLDSIETRGGTKAPAAEQDLFISVTAAGDVYVGERIASRRELFVALHAATQMRTDWRGNWYQVNVFVRVDKRAPFGAVRRVVQTAQAANRTRLTFLATSDQAGRAETAGDET